MPRRCWILGLALAAMAAGPAPAPAPASEGSTGPTVLALRFVQALNQRGYSDWALDYVEQLRKAPDTPADLREALDYGEAIGLAEEAAHTPDLARRAGIYDEAGRKLEVFLKAHPGHPLAAEAQKARARLLVEGGHIAVLRGAEAKLPGEADARQAEARALFGRARDAYARVEVPLKAAYDAMPKSLSEDDPLREERDRARDAWVEARLQRALVDYEEAQTYPPGVAERDAALDRARALFEEIANQHRTQMAGVVARMWQGRCFEERGGVGDLGRAMGIYDELMAEPDPRLKPLQRQVDYFRITLMGKRHDFALAADEATRWLREGPRERHTDEGLGVLVEYGRDLLAQAQAPDVSKDAAREATRKAADALTEVSRISSRHKRAAVILLRKVRATGAAPRAADASAPPPANMPAAEALKEAEARLDEDQFDPAIALLRLALRKLDPARDVEKVNRARIQLAFALYSVQRYDEADIVAEHLARHYPKDEVAEKAIQIALASLVNAYNQAKEGDRAGDAERLASLADFTARTIPDTEAADEARLKLGEIEMRRRRFAEAARALEALRESSPKRADALAAAGTAHWMLGQEAKARPDQAKAEVEKSADLLQRAIQLRRDSKTPPNDPALINNACDLAEIQLYRDRPADALALLEPLAKAGTDRKPSAEEAPLRARLISIELRALLANKPPQVDKAIAEMKALESVGGSGQSMAQLYVSLGRALEKQMEALKGPGDEEKLKETRGAYEAFLDALSSRKEGQTYETLEWAGEAMLALGAPAKAAPIFGRVLKDFGADPKWLAEPDAQPKLNRARIKHVVALREAKEFDRAQVELTPLLKLNLLDYYVEQARLLEARAEATGAGWDRAGNYWQNLAIRLGRGKTKGAEFFEAWYHAALAQSRQNKPTEALKLLRGIAIQYPTLGGPEMKTRYEELIRQVSAGR